MMAFFGLFSPMLANTFLANEPQMWFDNNLPDSRNFGSATLNEPVCLLTIIVYEQFGLITRTSDLHTSVQI